MARSASRPSRLIPTCRAADTAIRLDRRHRGGDFDALLTLLDPDVVIRIYLGALPAGGLHEVRGAAQAVGLAASYRRFAPHWSASPRGSLSRPTAGSPPQSWHSPESPSTS